MTEGFHLFFSGGGKIVSTARQHQLHAACGPGRWTLYSTNYIIIIIIVSCDSLDCAPAVWIAAPINTALVRCFGDQFGIKFELHSNGIVQQTIK